MRHRATTHLHIVRRPANDGDGGQAAAGELPRRHPHRPRWHRQVPGGRPGGRGRAGLLSGRLLGRRPCLGLRAGAGRLHGRGRPRPARGRGEWPSLQHGRPGGRLRGRPRGAAGPGRVRAGARGGCRPRASIARGISTAADPGHQQATPRHQRRGGAQGATTDDPGPCGAHLTGGAFPVRGRLPVHRPRHAGPLGLPVVTHQRPSRRGGMRGAGGEPTRRRAGGRPDRDPDPAHHAPAADRPVPAPEPRSS